MNDVITSEGKDGGKKWPTAKVGLASEETITQPNERKIETVMLYD